MADRRALPSWTAEADRVLREASRRITIISRATPRNLRSEHARLSQAWKRGDQAAPHFEYGPAPDVSAAWRILDSLGQAVSSEGALGAVYAARVEELILEARIMGAVGDASLSELCRGRFGYRDLHSTTADALAQQWAVTARQPADRADVLSDDASDPRSLLSRALKEIGARRLAVRVVLSPNLAPLAAVGEGILQVAEGRYLSSRDAERTALHEVLGHLVPQSRSALQPLGIFSHGTARGSDDQEGRALSLERSAGFLVGARCAELGRRHLAAQAALEGAHFVETVRLLKGFGEDFADDLRVALRAHRGSRGGLGGLGREIVYLPAMIRVEARLATDPEADEVLSRGRVAVSAIDTLRPFVDAT